MNKPKIVFLGAGSVVFGRNVIADILWHQALREIELVLVDIDAERLDTARGMALMINRQLGAGAEISATTDRGAALAVADFVINAIGVGGIAATEVDLNLPETFGLMQTVGDTLGVGGVFRAIRGVPVLLDVCQDISRLCPEALLINYSNPMAMHCLAVERATKVRHVGICHGVQGTLRTIMMYTTLMNQPPAVLQRHLQAPRDEPQRISEWLDWRNQAGATKMDCLVAGINHMAFVLRFQADGQDLYPRLHEAMQIPELWAFDPVRFELFRHLGLWMTETSRHCAEYVPFFLKSTDEIARLRLEPKSYLTTCREQEQQYRELRQRIISEQPVIASPYSPSIEYASGIINAMVAGEDYGFNGNVHNQGGRFIENLPGDCCVEVPCRAGKDGIIPVPVGKLPPQCAALIRTNVNVQDLAVEGILQGDRGLIRQAIMMDPNTAASLTLPQIDKLTEAMFKASRRWLPKNLL